MPRLFALVVGLALVLVLAAAVPTGVALAKKGCPMIVTVTDPADTGAAGQLRTAIAAVCDGGNVKAASTVTSIQLNHRIVIDKKVTVTGTGQTFQPYGFDVSARSRRHAFG